MNKIKYISFSLIVLLIGILCISSISIYYVNADGEYNFYEGEIFTDNTYLPDYAIVDIEKLVYNDNSVIRFKIDTSKFNSNYPIFYFSTKTLCISY